jgi:hypothetical protein
MGLGKWSFARLRPGHVAALTVAYWVGLATVRLGGLLVAIARVALPGMHGGVNAELKNLVGLQVRVTSSGGSVIWAGSTSLPVVLAWIVGPPLILALTARWARELERGDEEAGSAALGSGETTRVVGAPTPEWGAGGDRRSEAERRRRSHPERESP